MPNTVIQRFVISDEEVIEIKKINQTHYLTVRRKGQVILNEELIHE